MMEVWLVAMLVAPVAWYVGRLTARREVSPRGSQVQTRDLTGEPCHHLDQALDVIEQHKMQAFFYVPKAADASLDDAMKELGMRGYIFADLEGRLIGTLSKPRMTSDERALAMRSTFRLVEAKD